MSDKRPEFRVARTAAGLQIIENSTDLIWRTLETPREVAEWIDGATYEDRKKKIRN